MECILIGVMGLSLLVCTCIRAADGACTFRGARGPVIMPRGPEPTVHDRRRRTSEMAFTTFIPRVTCAPGRASGDPTDPSIRAGLACGRERGMRRGSRALPKTGCFDCPGENQSKKLLCATCAEHDVHVQMQCMCTCTHVHVHVRVRVRVRVHVHVHVHVHVRAHVGTGRHRHRHVECARA